MTTLQLPGEINTAFDHLAAYGLAAILERSGAASPRIAWKDELDSHPRLERALPWEEAARVVKAHADSATQPNSWVQQNADNAGRPTALFSPRVKTLPEPEIRQWYALRYAAIDRIEPKQRLDLEFIGALGEPAYWAADRGDPRPDHGASRWEMKARNRGEEFVGNRLRLLAGSVAQRDVKTIARGLRGDGICHEDASPSANRTPTGLMAPGPADKARAWCALWGLSLTAVTHRSQSPITPSGTAGHFGSYRRGSFYLPVMTVPLPLTRLRSILYSDQLRQAAMDEDRGTSEWLREQGVFAVSVFPVFRSSNESAPERWAQRGNLIMVGS
jgi:CRISPR-associated protein Csb3